MRNIKKHPYCFWFVDYINICSIRVYNDIVCLEGVYHDPVSSKVIPAYFEADFTWLYEILNESELVNNAQKAFEALTASMAAGQEGGTIELEYDDVVEFHTMVIRLSTMFEDYPQNAQQFSGFFIEDSYPMDQGLVSFNNYIPTPHMGELDKRTRTTILRKVRNMSGHLVALALRYEYYTYCHKSGTPEDEALFKSSLTDVGVFEAARAAFEYITSVKGELVI